MVGKEYVYFRSIMEMRNLSQFGHWGIDAYPFATRLVIEKLFSQIFGLMASAKISQPRTLAQN